MLVAERGAAANTVEAYGRDLADFSGFMRRRRRAPEDAGADDVRAYLSVLADSGLDSRTGARRLSALRQFFRFLFASGVRSDDPTAVIDSPRPKKIPAEIPFRGRGRRPSGGGRHARRGNA